MSLNRKQWEEMWACCKRIENEMRLLNEGKIRKEHAIPNMKLDIIDIKTMIQSVIGQME